MSEAHSKRPMSYGVIYVVTHVASGRRYVGQTTQSIASRWAAHCKETYCRRLHNAIKKYGPEEFEIRELAWAKSKEELDSLECFYINEFKTTDRALGFNLRHGGSFGKHSEESKRVMSERVRHALEHGNLRQKLSAAQKGRVITPEHATKIAASNTGKRHSEATVQKMSEISKKRLSDPDERERLRQASIAGRNKPGHREQVAEKARAAWADPQIRAKYMEAHANMTPEAKARQHDANRALWAVPEIRAARIAQMSETTRRLHESGVYDEANAKRKWRSQNLSEEARAARSQLSQSMWDDPEKRAAIVANMRAKADVVGAKSKAMWDDPEQRAKIIEAQRAGKKAMWADPVKKAEIMAKRAATQARKKAEAEAAKAAAKPTQP